MSKRTISVEIDCEDETCGDCGKLEKYGWGNDYRVECVEFRYFFHRGLNPKPPFKRCQECIKAEQPAHGLKLGKSVNFTVGASGQAHEIKAEHKREE